MSAAQLKSCYNYFPAPVVGPLSVHANNRPQCSTVHGTSYVCYFRPASQQEGSAQEALEGKGDGLHATPVSERPRAFNKWFATGGWTTREGSIIIYNDRFERVAESSWRSTLIPFNEVQIPESRKPDARYLGSVR